LLIFGLSNGFQQHKEKVKALCLIRWSRISVSLIIGWIDSPSIHKVIFDQRWLCPHSIDGDRNAVRDEERLKAK
jgi:hypothetical protein